MFIIKNTPKSNLYRIVPTFLFTPYTSEVFGDREITVFWLKVLKIEQYQRSEGEYKWVTPLNTGWDRFKSMDGKRYIFLKFKTQIDINNLTDLLNSKDGNNYNIGQEIVKNNTLYKYCCNEKGI